MYSTCGTQGGAADEIRVDAAGRRHEVPVAALAQHVAHHCITHLYTRTKIDIERGIKII